MAFGYKVRWEKSWYKKGQKEPHTLSRSKVELFTECKRCFWMDQRYGIGRPSSFPFTLNNAVDELFKKEFDILREKGEAHPLMKQYKIDAIPFKDERMEEWRDALKRGVKVHHEESNIILRGGVDDVWQNSKGELHVVDYKATAGKAEVTLDDEWKNSYKRQVEIYQWLFRGNGFDVSPIAYFVYANGRNDKDSFDAMLEFDITILPHVGDDSWVSGTLIEMKKLLEEDAIPKASVDCEYCEYRKVAGQKLMELHTKK
ncbi:MAG: PD-(D/E)XK nuclease family protein [Candidatus Pacebacteria bacterium]|nr:PD-(D/E)XK nuclease family protein [Candidatus Paceibacterota bacterium]